MLLVLVTGRYSYQADSKAFLRIPLTRQKLRPKKCAILWSNCTFSRNFRSSRNSLPLVACSGSSRIRYRDSFAPVSSRTARYSATVHPPLKGGGNDRRTQIDTGRKGRRTRIGKGQKGLEEWRIERQTSDKILHLTAHC